jgi:hypothetical protein
VACITIEDAAMLARMQDRGVTPRIRVYMEAHTLPNVTSYNVVAEITGSKYPDQVVLVSGHLDSWDVGQVRSRGPRCVLPLACADSCHPLPACPRPVDDDDDDKNGL